MGIIASVAAFLGQKPRTASNRKVPEAYKAMSAAELKDRAMAGDVQAETALRQRAASAGN